MADCGLGAALSVLYYFISSKPRPHVSALPSVYRDGEERVNHGDGPGDAGMEASSFLRQAQVALTHGGQRPPATEAIPSLQAMGAASRLGFQGGGEV